jgi:hypothetical protein
MCKDNLYNSFFTKSCHFSLNNKIENIEENIEDIRKDFILEEVEPIKIEISKMLPVSDEALTEIGLILGW